MEGAIDFYRNLLRPDIGQMWTAALEPRHVLEMARLLGESGDTAAAREHYQRFIDLWMQADVQIAELEKARSRSSTLSSQSFYF